MPLSRRRFLGLAATASAALIVGGCASFARPTRKTPLADDGKDLPFPEVASEEIPDGLQFVLARAIPLGSEGSPVLVRLRREGAADLPIAIYREEGGALSALVAECPDFGGPLVPRKTGFKRYWQARRHGSRFSWDGATTMRGPAKGKLRRVCIYESGGFVVVRNSAP